MWGGINDWLGATNNATSNDRASEDEVEEDTSDITSSFWSAFNLIKEKVSTACGEANRSRRTYNDFM